LQKVGAAANPQRMPPLQAGYCLAFGRPNRGNRIDGLAGLEAIIANAADAVCRHRRTG